MSIAGNTASISTLAQLSTGMCPCRFLHSYADDEDGDGDSDDDDDDDDT